MNSDVTVTLWKRDSAGVAGHLSARAHSVPGADTSQYRSAARRVEFQVRTRLRSSLGCSSDGAVEIPVHPPTRCVINFGKCPESMALERILGLSIGKVSNQTRQPLWSH